MKLNCVHSPLHIHTGYLFVNGGGGGILYYYDN